MLFAKKWWLFTAKMFYFIYGKTIYFHASLKVSKAKLICRFVKIMYYYAFFLLNNLGAQRHKSRSPVLNSYYCF